MIQNLLHSAFEVYILAGVVGSIPPTLLFCRQLRPNSKGFAKGRSQQIRSFKSRNQRRPRFWRMLEQKNRSYGCVVQL